jgi:hypothetical protein
MSIPITAAVVKIDRRFSMMPPDFRSLLHQQQAAYFTLNGSSATTPQSWASEKLAPHNCLRGTNIWDDAALTSTRNHSSLIRRPLTRRW